MGFIASLLDKLFGNGPLVECSEDSSVELDAIESAEDCPAEVSAPPSPKTTVRPGTKAHAKKVFDETLFLSVEKSKGVQQRLDDVSANLDERLKQKNGG